MNMEKILKDLDIPRYLYSSEDKPTSYKKIAEAIREELERNIDSIDCEKTSMFCSVSISCEACTKERIKKAFREGL